MVERSPCPYCLADISLDAQVCRYCARDVGKLRRALARVESLEAEVPNGRSTRDQNGERSVFGVPLLVSYMAGTAYFWYAIQPENGFAAWVLPLIWGLTGAVLVIHSRSCQLWRLFLLGFGLPFLAIVTLAVLNVLSLTLVLRQAPVLFQIGLRASLFLGLAGLTTAAVVSALHIRSIQIDLKASHALDWLLYPESKTDRLQKLVLKVSAVGTPLISLASAIMSAINGQQ